MGACIALTFRCTANTAAAWDCAPGTDVLVEDALEAGSCSSLFDYLMNYAFGDALTSLYVCNTTNCNSHAALLALPRAPPPRTATFLVSASFVLRGYTVATFGAAQKTQFAAVLAAQLAVLPASITITSVTAASAASPPGGAQRRLLQQGGAAGGIIVAFTVETASPAALSASLVAVAGSASFVTQLQLGGLTALTGVATYAQQTSSAAVQPDAQAAEEVASPAPANLGALGALAVLLLPIAAALWCWRRNRAVALGASPEWEPDEQHVQM
jgi:hypothetical protein